MIRPEGLWAKIAAVLGFAQSLAMSAAAALVWMVLWRVALGAFGFPIIARTPEARATYRRRQLDIGKARYMVLFGILGYGFAFGLALSVPDMSLHGARWLTAIRFLFGVLFFGLWMGLRNWKETVAQS